MGIFLVSRKGKESTSNLPSHKLERITIHSATRFESNGNVFLPRTIRFTEERVKPKKLKLSIAGKIFTYEEWYDDRTYWLDPSQEVREVPVIKGDLISVSGIDETTIFFAREM
jgi:hypothetical protein